MPALRKTPIRVDDMTRKSEQAGTLRRGSACLSCRRRKLRCNGERPVCTPCKSMKRVHECNYDDSSRKTHTQTLREKVFALEAKVRELESSTGANGSTVGVTGVAPETETTTTAAWLSSMNMKATIDADRAIFTHSPQPMLDFREDDAFGMLEPTIGMGMVNIWTGYSAGYPYPYDALDIPLDLPSSASSSSDGSMSRTLSMMSTAPPPSVRPSVSMSFTPFNDTPVGQLRPPPLHPNPHSQSHSLDLEEYGDGSDRKVSVSREMHDKLVSSFLRCRTKCCFFSDPTRLDARSSSVSPSPAASTSSRRIGARYGNEAMPMPNAALMSAIYLLGWFFGPRDDDTAQMEQRLVEQTLADVARLLHIPYKLLDTIQALCLLAQYYFFTNDLMQGSRHLAAAKRIAFDAGLHQLAPIVFLQHDYTFPNVTHEFSEKSAVFWQTFMVSNLWSSAIDRHVLSPTFDPPCRHITTPLPVDGTLPMEAVAGNSPLHALFDVDIDVKYKAKSLKPSAFRAMAACIFDHSVRVHNTALRDDTYRRSAEVALDRFNSLMHPMNWPDASSTDHTLVDPDLYLIHTLVVAATIHLHKDNTMDLKMLWAAKKVVELINYLTEEDYELIDPVLSVCWASIVRIFREMIQAANQRMHNGDPGAATAPWTVNYLQSCVNTLLSALQRLGTRIPIAESYLESLEYSEPPTPQPQPQYHQELAQPYAYHTETEYALPEIFGF